MIKNGHTYFKNLAVITPQDFESMFGHFLTLPMKGLISKVKFVKNPVRSENIKPLFYKYEIFKFSFKVNKK